MFTNRFQGIVATNLILSGILCSFPGGAQAQQAGRPVTISVDDSRPLAQAVLELEIKSGWPITYEDPPYAHPSDVVDVTVRRDLGQALVPRGGRFEFHTFLAPRSQKLADATPVIQSLLDTFNRSGYPGSFMSKKSGQIFHVVPVQIQNKDGRLIDLIPILDVPITLPEQERSGIKALQDITQAISKLTGTQIIVGTIPLNLFLPRTRLAAANEPARDVIVRLVQSTNRKLSWQLLYDPGARLYALNLHIVLSEIMSPAGLIVLKEN